MSDWDWLKAKSDAANRVEAELLQKAKAEALRTGKEPFHYETLLTLYDPTSELGVTISDHVETAAALERRYYVDYPGVLTLRDFADKLTRARYSL